MSSRDALVIRLREAASQGADLSPGDRLCKEALEMIERLEHDLADANIRINDLETEVATLRANA